MNLAKHKPKWIAALCALTLMFTPLMGHAEAAVVAAPLSKMASPVNGMVRVHLASISSKTSLSVTVNGSYSLGGNSSQALQNGENMKVSINTSTGNLTLTRGGQAVSMGKSFQLRRHSAGQAGGILISESLNASNPYPGDMLFTAQQQGGVYKLYAIAHVFIEDYLYGVVPYEMGNSAHIEALKAQAVAARTYTYNKMKSRAGSLYDVVDNTNDQVYRGTPSGSANCKAAVDATRGIVSMAGDSLVETYYTASNGGQTESSQNAWGSARSYLIVKNDPFDLANTDAEVRKTTVYADFNDANQKTALKTLLNSKAKQAAASMGYDGASVQIQKITSVVPHTPKYQSPSSLYTYVDFFVTAQVKKTSGTLTTATLQLTCGIFSELESALSMSINTTSNELWTVEKSGGNFTLYARRFGHGIGLSQRGAMQMGRQGYSYADILGFYYTGSRRSQITFTNTILPSLSDGGSSDIVTPVDPADIEGEDAACTAVVSLINKQSALGIYGSASTSAEVIGAVPDGAPVRVYAIKGDWCFIGYGQVYGYAQKSGLSISGDAPEETDLKPSSITQYAVVTANGYLNLRQSGSASATIVGTAPSGAVLSVFSKENGWAYIQYGAITAYASTSFLTFHATYPLSVADPTQNAATVTLSDPSETVNMRANASLTASVVAKLAHGTQVTLLKDDGSWSQIIWQGQQGYIMSSYLTVSGSAPEPTPTPTPPSLTARVNGGGAAVTVYAAEDEASQAVGQLDDQSVVTVLTYGSVWSQVQKAEVTGYVKTAQLLFGSEGETDKTEYATVTTVSGSLNLRSKASAGSSILCTIPRNMRITVLERGATWTNVTYNGYTGYVMTMYLTFETSGNNPTPTPPPSEGALSARVTTASGSLNLRSEANSGAKVLTTIPRNTIITVYEKAAQWSRVHFGGIDGYVLNSFLTFINEPAPTPGETPEPGATPSPTPGGTLYARVTTASGSLNLRQERSTGAKVLASIPRNTVLEVSDRQDIWSAVKYLSHSGYVMTSFLTFDASVPSLPVGNTARVTTSGGSLNVRMSANGIILGAIPNGRQVTVLEKGSAWSQINYQGLVGYVANSYLTFETPAATSSPSPSPSASPEASEAPETSAPPAPKENTEEPAGTLPDQSTDIPSDEPADTVADEVTGAPSGEAAPQAEKTAALDPTLSPMPQDSLAWVIDSTEAFPLYEQCDEASARMGTLPGGATVLLIQKGDTWCEIEYNGQSGYVLTRILSLPE